MTRWFTSDLHFSHANIARFCGRPFVTDQYVNGILSHVTDTHHMNTSICENINTHVTPDDELWILGDVALGNIDHSLPIVRRLTAGRIVIVTGNHDRCHPYNKKKSAGWLERYQRLTGAEIINGNTELTLMDGTNVQVSHFPYAGDSYDRSRNGTIDDRFAEWRPHDDGRWLLCGHVHEKWRRKGRMINVGIDAWGGSPVSEETLTTIIAGGEAGELPRLVWATFSPHLVTEPSQEEPVHVSR